METGELEAAKQGFRRALSMDGGLILARYNLARACQLLGHMDAAAEHYRLVLAMDEGHAEAHNNPGLVLSTE